MTKKELDKAIKNLHSLGYREVTEEELFDNVKYTLEEVKDEIDKPDKSTNMEATIVFKEGVQTHIVFNITFTEVEHAVDTEYKLDHIEFNDTSEDILYYMIILGKTLINEAISTIEDLDKDIKESDILGLLDGIKYLT